MTVSLVFSANLEATTPPTLHASKNRKQKWRVLLLGLHDNVDPTKQGLLPLCKENQERLVRTASVSDGALDLDQTE